VSLPAGSGVTEYVVAPRPSSLRAALVLGRRRLRGRIWPIVQTAAAAVIAWYLAVLALPGNQPLFAPIAAVIAVGAAYGQRLQRAAELVGGVILGIAVADLIVQAIGRGPWQAGVMVVLAMTAAVAMGGRELLVSEAAVSAILIATITPDAGGFPPTRFFEALIGGGVALAVGALLFPPDPALQVARALNAVFAQLGRALAEVGQALEAGDEHRAERALESARAIDENLTAVRDELLEVRETARFAPRRRRSRGQIGRFERALPQLDFAVRDTRVLARNALRFLRGDAPAPPEVAAAVQGLADAVFELAATFEDERRAGEVRRAALDAAGGVTAVADDVRDLRLAEIVVQVRSVAVDLVRAADLAEDAEPGDERPTDELLISSA
jgi:uncharacterized membrane protein YgaE (UPF0421/DUF939 family)